MMVGSDKEIAITQPFSKQLGGRSRRAGGWRVNGGWGVLVGSLDW